MAGPRSRGNADVSYAEDVANALVRGIGAFIRVAQTQKLTPGLRRLRSFRPQTLARHRAELLAALEDEELRSAILEWLDEGHPPLKPAEAEFLRVATERSDGWQERLERPRTEKKSIDPKAALEAKLARLEDALARERDKARAARADARRAKDESKRAGEGRRELEEKLGATTAALREAREKLGRAVSATERVRAAADKDSRRVEKSAAKAAARAAEQEVQLRAARKELGRAERRVEQQEGEVERLKARIDGLRARVKGLEAEVGRLTDQLGGRQTATGRTRSSRASRETVREPLPVPKGRMPEDPQTLEEWLGAPQVRLLVDGYNVTKAEGGFGGVSLESQRDRLVAEVRTLAARKRTPTTIVFDGSVVTPGTARRNRGGVIVEYSAPGETADDHIVALLESDATSATIVVTNDRALQDRAAARGATIATSTQLLALIR
jgi:predicted RNA-binding protein with PIN domain